MQQVKRVFVKVAVFLLGLSTAVSAWVGGLAESAVDITLALSPAVCQQTVTGFGTSACWWSHRVTDDNMREDLMKQLYSKDGLALNIYRYNVGGGVNPDHNRVSNDWHNTESFYVFDEAQNAWVYDFTRDANAQKALQTALSYGCIDTVILFANSPHYSMTVSGEASGGVADGESNLDPAHEQDFVDYFLTITQHFLDEGVPVKYISPINEPQWGWGGPWVHQEGCHYETEQLVRVLHLFAEGIERQNLPVQLSVPEAGEIGELTKEYFTAIGSDPVILRNTGSFAYHSYWKDTLLEDKAHFRDWFDEQIYADRTLDMTEWCELPNKHATSDPMAAVIMARVMANDLNFSRVNSWSSWVAVNTEGISDEGLDFSDGLFSADPGFTRYEKSFRYWAMAHFSRFIPAGSRLLPFAATPDDYRKSTYDRRVDTDFAAFRTPNCKTVVVISNEGPEKTIRLQTPGLHMTVYTTDETRRLEQTYNGRRLLSLTIPAVSVTTVVIDNDIGGLFQ